MSGKPKTRTYSWLDGFAFGLLVAGIFVCVFFWVAQVDIRGRFDDYMIALLTATAAIGAAYMAVAGIRAQIMHSVEVETGRRKDALDAAKSMLPLALSELSQASTSNIRRHFDPADLMPSSPHSDNIEKFPFEALAAVKSCIQYADERARAELAYLIRAYQVLAARDSDVNKGRKIPKAPAGNLSEYGRIGDALNWAELHASIDNLFEFARDICADVEPFNTDTVWNSLLHAGLSQDDFPNVSTILEGRIADGRVRLRFAPR